MKRAIRIVLSLRTLSLPVVASKFGFTVVRNSKQGRSRTSRS